MRLTICYRVVRTKGFFLGRRLFFYNRRYGGYVAPTGVGSRSLLWFRHLTDGLWPRITRPWVRQKDGSYVRKSKYRRWRNAGLMILAHLSPLIDHFWPLVWATLRYLKIRHYRGARYRRGLPAHGQRTHSNAATTRRVRGVVANYLKAHYWFGKLWQPRKRPVLRVGSRVRGQSKRAAKAERHKRGVIRTKKIKKTDAWR